jgi:solute carrier family 25 2-oxodicarboxylate transporter 21
MDVVKKIIARDGVLGMYAGLESTFWRHVLWNGGYFSVIFKLRQIAPKAKSKPEQLFNDFCCGAVGGTVGTMLNTPADVFKSRVRE